MKPILQVEDDPNDVFFLRKAMKKAGLINPIQVVSDGQMAIDYLSGSGKFADRAQFPLPCLVLLDLKLPIVTGLEVLKCIRRDHGMRFLVVLLSSSCEASDVAMAYRLGANGFLAKPSDPKRLEAIARAILDFWVTHNVAPPDSDQAAVRCAGAGPMPPCNRSVAIGARAPGTDANTRELLLSKPCTQNPSDRLVNQLNRVLKI